MSTPQDTPSPANPASAPEAPGFPVGFSENQGAENGASQLGQPIMFGQASIVDALRGELADIVANETVFIPIQGYDGTGLQAKYRLPESGRELGAIVDRVVRQHKDVFSRNLFTTIDTMITLCEGLYVQPLEADEPVELDPKERGEPVKFDGHLAEIIGMKPDETTARGVVRKLFAGNDLAIIAHGEKLDRWLRNTKADPNETFGNLGEV